jgi:CheY-like chemotaxis protein
MPEMDGAALIRNIRKEGNMIPVIILSSYDKEQVEELINDENVVSLRKPFESVDLIKKINSLLLDDMH